MQRAVRSAQPSAQACHRQMPALERMLRGNDKAVKQFSSDQQTKATFRAPRSHFLFCQHCAHPPMPGVDGPPAPPGLGLLTMLICRQ